MQITIRSEFNLSNTCISKLNSISQLANKKFIISYIMPYSDINLKPGGYKGLSKAPPNAVAVSNIKGGKSLRYFNQLVTKSGRFQAS